LRCKKVKTGPWDLEKDGARRAVLRMVPTRSTWPREGTTWRGAWRAGWWAPKYPYALSQISGCPMIVVPVGICSQGLPFGLQVLGPRWEDERLLEIAHLFSELVTGFQRPPGY
jgi:Asp-tRNA(Asn)/Glu-tRNA(Gln) amidotransferase A subunit family amidase